MQLCLPFHHHNPGSETQPPKPTLWFIAFAAAIKAFIGCGHAPFTASFFLRNHTDEIAGLAKHAGGVFGFDMGPVGFLGRAFGLIVGMGAAYSPSRSTSPPSPSAAQ